MAKKRKNRQPRDDRPASDAPLEDRASESKPEHASSKNDILDDTGAKVQARLDGDIGLDHSLPLHHLRKMGNISLGLGLIGLLLTVPAEWLSWSRLIVAFVAASGLWLVAPASVGQWNCESLLMTGSLLILFALGKLVTGFPALLGTGPGALFLVTSAWFFMVGALARVGARSGPAALLAREVKFVKLQEPFGEQLARLRDADPEARAPVVLQCRRCGVVFMFHADRITISTIGVESLESSHQAWMDINRCRANFEARIEEPAVCPRCDTADDYVYAEHPAVTLGSVLEASRAKAPASRAAGTIVHAHLTFTGDGRPCPVLERWVQLRKALEDDEAAVAPRVEMARLYRWLKLGGLARENCERALDLDSKNTSAWILMGDLMRDRGEEEAAQMLIADAALNVLGDGDPIDRLKDHPELEAALMGHVRRGRGRRRW